MGLALKEIRDNRYYRELAGSFEEYMEKKFGYSRGRGYQLIASAEVSVNVDDYSAYGDDPVRIRNVYHGTHPMFV